jgi:hypothetical protein
VVEICPQYDNDEEFKTYLEKVHDRPFDQLPDLPVWRAIVAYDSAEASLYKLTITFLIHHAVGDGGSAMAFHHAYVHALDELLSSDQLPKGDAIVLVPKHDMLPSIEQAHDLPYSYQFAAKRLYNYYFGKNDDAGHWSGNPVTTENFKTQLRMVYISPSTVSALLKLCRREKVSLNALIALIVVRNMAKANPEYQRFSCTDAMSFRRFTGTDKNAIVNYVSSLSHKFSVQPQEGYIPCGGDFSWDPVRMCRAEIEQGTSSPKDQSVSMLRLHKDYKHFLERQIGKRRAHSFELTNVGVLGSGPTEKLEHVRITRVIFTQSACIIGTPCSFSISTAKDGDLSICLSWQKGIVDAEMLEGVGLKVKEDLESLSLSS